MGGHSRRGALLALLCARLPFVEYVKYSKLEDLVCIAFSGVIHIKVYDVVNDVRIEHDAALLLRGACLYHMRRRVL